MKHPIFTGSAVAIVTPFKDGGVDFETLGELLDFQLENGTDAVVVCGTTGEASAMTYQERSEAVASASGMWEAGFRSLPGPGPTLRKTPSPSPGRRSAGGPTPCWW